MRTRYLAVCLLLIAAMCAATLYCWPSLSARVPVHWNVRNAVMGIRTPWTLASKAVWYATHRLAARLMVASGLLGLCALWLGAPHWLLLTVMLAWVPLVTGYSLLLYKRLPH